MKDGFENDDIRDMKKQLSNAFDLRIFGKASNSPGQFDEL